MTYRRFEELPAWQMARLLARLIYAASSKGRFQHDWELRSQVRKTAISMMANIAEGFCRWSDKEFAQSLFTAKASAGEFQSHLYVALDRNYLDDSSFHQLFRATEDFARQTSGLISYLTGHKKSRRAG